jgi:hypothetical protein
MKTRTRIVYWALTPLAIAAYIVAMAQPSEKRDEQRGPRPNAYAEPRGHAWGVGHGRGGPPSKVP